MLVRMAEQMEALKRELAITAAALAECQGRLALNSTNSSKPPSSDGLNKPKPKPKPQRQSGKRASGGQPGHPGKTLRQVAEPHHVEQHGPAPQCDACGLMRQAQVVQVRRVFDLPAKRHEVTEHQLMQAQCQCGKVHRGVFPAGVAAPVQYGPRVLAAAADLNQHQMLPQQRSAELLGEVCGLPMSAATVQMATQRVQGQITPVVLAIRQALLGVHLRIGTGGLRSTSVTQLHHYYTPIRHPQHPTPPLTRSSLPGCQPGTTTDFPCCTIDRLSCVLPPLPRWTRYARITLARVPPAAFLVVRASRHPRRHFEACSEAESFSSVPEQRVKRRPI